MYIFSASCDSVAEKGISNPTMSVFPWLSYYEDLKTNPANIGITGSLAHSSSQSLNSVPESLNSAPFGTDDSSSGHHYNSVSRYFQLKVCAYA